MASADFSPALTEKLSPGKALILFLRAVRLYLARLVWILGFAVASTLTARTRPLCRFVFLQSKYSFPASFGFHRAACAPRLPLCGSLRLPPSVPAGSFHPARISPCWAHWRAPPAVPCRHSWRHVCAVQAPPAGYRENPSNPGPPVVTTPPARGRSAAATFRECISRASAAPWRWPGFQCRRSLRPGPLRAARGRG